MYDIIPIICNDILYHANCKPFYSAIEAGGLSWSGQIIH